jgi:hypothetical protein
LVRDLTQVRAEASDGGIALRLMPLKVADSL